MPTTLELCCGTKSFTKVARERGYTHNITIDIDPRFSPTICIDILEWDYRQYAGTRFDLIWCSPPCTMYSNARTTGAPPDLVTADNIVQRCLDIIHFFQPTYWYIENPASSLLKTREVMQPYNHQSYIVDYCQYGNAERRKRTRIWTNVAGFTPRRCPRDWTRCPAMIPNTNKHKGTCTGNYWDKQRWKSKKDRAIDTGQVPAQLIRELLLHASAQTATHRVDPHV